MQLNRVVAGAALLFALLLGGLSPLQHAFGEMGKSGNQEPLIPEGQRKTAPNFILTDAKGRNTVAVLWLFAAGLIALLALARLHWVEGVRFRYVKSGEFYKRALVLAKRMRVPLSRVAVVPFGRGHLTNAYSRSDEIAITDDYGHWLSGSRLDFAVGHELAHAKNKHGRKKLLITIAVFVAVSLPVEHRSNRRTSINIGIGITPI